jgi:hypothetical protein
MRHSEERKLKAMETEYLALLTAALKRCANGQWGLFGQNDAVLAKLGKNAGERFGSKEVADLLEFGSQIEKLRNKLGYPEAFPVHQRLVNMRASNNPNSQGEPKLARGWLDELGL